MKHKVKNIHFVGLSGAVALRFFIEQKPELVVRRIDKADEA
jgi:hypothetical protein